MTERITKIVGSFFALYLAFCATLLVWVVVYSGSGDGDTLEHVHTSWLVYQGKIPYKDFFQHHNPLLWYLGAPLVGLYEYSLRAVDAVNMLTVFCSVVTWIYVYRIHSQFLSGKLCGLISASFCALPHDSLFNKDFKPDNYMCLALVLGIYYLFKYIKEKRLHNLVLSFLSLFASFMFTQKSALEVICIGFIVLYLIYKKEVSIKDCLIASILPLLIFSTFLAFLYSQDIFILYFKANFELNSHIPDVFYTRRFIYPSYETIVPIILSLVAMVFCLYQGSIYVKVAGLVFISEYIIRLFYFTPFVYYFAFLHASSSIFSGVGASYLINKYRHIIWLFVGYFLLVGGIYIKNYHWRITVGDDYKYGASGFVLRHTNPCDYVVNGYRIGYNLFNKDIDFIWNLKGQIDVIAATIGIRPTSDLERLIRQYRPKIIYGKNYYDTYMEYRGNIGVYPIHMISSHLLNEMYIPLNRDDLYILKPEYQSYDCRYNPYTRTYEYRD